MSTAPGNFKTEEELDNALLEAPEVKEATKTEVETTETEDTPETPDVPSDKTETPTTTTDKTTVDKTTAPAVDDELLAILNAGDTPADEQTLEQVFSVYDKLKAEAAKNKWESEALTQVLSTKDSLLEITRELDAKDQQLKEAVDSFKEQTSQLQTEFAEFLAPLGLTARVFHGRNWPAVLLEAAKQKFSTATPVKTGLEPEDDDDVPLTKGEWKKLQAQRAATPSPTTSPVPTTRTVEESDFQKWQREKANEELRGTATTLSTHWINKNPLLAVLAKKDAEYAKAVTAKIQARVSASNLAEAIGRDKAGLGIKKIVDDYASEVKAAFKAAGLNLNAPKKGEPVPGSGGKPNTGDIKEFKKIPTHREVDGKKVRLTADEQQDMLDDEFANVLGLKS